MRFRTVFVGTWALFALLSSVWSLGSPLFSAADEPAHVIKAAAVVRGQFLGEQADPPAGEPAQQYTPFIITRVPAPYFLDSQSIGCTALHPKQPATCLVIPPDRPGDVSAVTTAGRYDPEYYLLVGWPTLVLLPHVALYAMRVVSGVLSALFLALAVAFAVVHGRRWLALAVGVAATPQAMFFAGVVNPSGLEIATATACWVLGLLLVTAELDSRRRSSLVIAFAACLVVLLPLRSLSPLWAALIVLSVLAIASWRRVLEVAKTRTTWFALPVVAACAAFAVLWTLRAHALTVVPVAGFGNVGLREATRTSFEHTPQLVSQFIGSLGWLDTPVPELTYWVWFGSVAVLAVLGLAAGSWWGRLVLAAVAAAVVLVPVAISAPSVQEVGYVWQGRYTLPLAVGVPLVAGHLRDRAGPSRWLGPTVAGLLLLALAVGEIGALLAALHRWAVGVDGPWDFLGVGWMPPTGMIAVVAAGVVAAVSLRLWLFAVFLTAPVPPRRAGSRADTDLRQPVPAGSG